MKTEKRDSLAPIVTGSAVLLVLLLGAVFLARTILSHKVAAPKPPVAQVVRIIRPPPPPPDQPPPPPPPPKVEEQIPKETPEKSPDEKPEPDLNQQLGLDAQGSAGGDDFGLAARHGGSDLIGGGNNPFGGYTSIVREAVLQILADDQRVRKGNYSVVVRIWLERDGRVSRVALGQSSASRDQVAAIQQDLSRVGRMAQAPPLEMPEPVILRIVSKG
jgi:protein TonB